VKDFILPDIGEGIVECEIVEWRVREGDLIEEDQPVCDVMTDKALVEIPSVFRGKVAKLYYKKGEIAKVHAPLFSIDVAGEVVAIDDKNDASCKSKAKESNHTSNVSNHTFVEEFILPDVGEGIAECEIVEWLVEEGDVLQEDQPVCDIMTDKALVQIPAKHAGKVLQKHYKKGDIAKVHSPLFSMEVEGVPHSGQSQDSKKKAATVEAENRINQQTVVDIRSHTVSKKAISSPSVRRLARELDIDLTRVSGSGDKGRIYKEDVLAFRDNHAFNSQPTSISRTKPQLPTVTTTGGFRTEPISGMMAVMASRMTKSTQTIPHFTFSEEIDLTELMALRTSLKEVYAKQNITLTLMPFFMKALSLSLKAFPQVNVQTNDKCSKIYYFDDHNIGVAVDSKLGLLVPSIKQCQLKSMRDIAIELTQLTIDAREGRVSPESLKGGTISISNIGTIGGTVATPIINQPEAAIVALGRVQTLPRFDDASGNVEARQIMQVSWSADHRILDGATIARFNNTWKGYLEKPMTMLPELL